MNEFNKIILPISLFIVSIILYTYFGKVDEIVKASGKIVVASENKTIQHYEGGILKKVYIKEGEEVKIGDPLISIKNISFKSKEKEIEILLSIHKIRLEKYKALVNEQDFIKNKKYNEIEKKVYEKEYRNYNNEKSKLKYNLIMNQNQIDQKVYKIRELDLNLVNAKIEKSISLKSFKIMKNLYKTKTISEKEYLDEKLKLQKINTRIESLKNQIPVIKNELKEIKTRKEIIIKEMKIQWNQSLSELNEKIIQEIETLKALNDRTNRMIIKSPINGIINKIEKNTIGSTIKQGENILDIIPINDELIIEAEIKDRDRANVWINQKTRISINALDSSIYGYIEGDIIYISPDSYIKQNNNEVIYNIKIKTKNVSDLLKKKIKPGMTVVANIITGQKYIYQYIIKPLKYIKNNTFIER